MKEEQHPLTRCYLDDVCREIIARELRKEIRQELEGHLGELIDGNREKGMNEEEAARTAIMQMGDSAVVAAGLNEIHKPRIPWGMLSCLMVLIGFALVTMYSLELGYAADPGKFMDHTRFFILKAVFTAVGLFTLVHSKTLNFSIFF